MSLSKDQQLWKEWKANTFEVCPNPSNSEVRAYNFSRIYAPPLSLGLPCTLLQIVPALHGYMPDGSQTHIRHPNFQIIFNLN